MILIRIPPTLVNANFTGLPFCLSFAKGIVVSASKPMIAAAKDKYSGCWVICNNTDKGCCNNIRTIERRSVEMINEMLVLLYTFLLSALLAKRKKAVSIP